MRYGLVELLVGLRFLVGAFVVNLKQPASVAASFDLTLPNALPVSTLALTVDPAGVMGYGSLSSGTVTSFSAGNLSPLFTSSVVNATTTPALSFSLSNAAQNAVFAGPTSGSGTPTYRTLVAADIPTLTAAKISDFDTQVRTSRLDQMAVPTTAVSANSQRITSVADPTSAQDAATKAYVDALIQGLDVKNSVRAATTANITLSGTQTIDGVALVANDRVLVKDQTTASANGIYVVAAGAWSRSNDADLSADVTAGMFVFVTEGTTNGDSGWTLTTNDAITLGTTSLTFTQFSGAGQITAGAGLTKTGNSLDVVGTANRVVVNTDSIDIAATYVGQTSITTLGTIATGTWQGTAIAVAYGGTGATTAAAARSNLSAAGVYRTSFTNASLTAGVLTLTHNLSQFCDVRIYDNNNKQVQPDDVTATSATAAAVDLSSFGTLSGTWNAVVVG
jgi:hypothetical protein